MLSETWLSTLTTPGTRAAFTALVLALVVQRLLELRRSRLNQAELLRRGGREHGQGHFPLMAGVHATWFLAMLAEVHVLGSELSVPLTAIAALLTLAGQALRLSAMQALGVRWCVRIVTLPGAAPVRSGIYRWMRHPNYVGVVLEILAVPLLHGASLTAALFTVLNAVVLAIRIRAEEQALEADNAYLAAMAGLPSFVPKWRSPGA